MQHSSSANKPATDRQPATATLATRPQRLLRDGMLAAAASNPEKTALVIEGKAYTYAELRDASARLAQAMLARGIVKGDRIAIYLENGWPCIVAIYATLLAGGVFVLINPQVKADKLAYLLDDSDARLLLSDMILFPVFSAAVNNNTKLDGIIVDGAPEQLPNTLAIPLESFGNLLATHAPLATPVAIIPNDLAALIYTSGSTGLPKGVMQTHQAMVFAAWSLIEYQRLSAEHRILLVLPLAFDYGLYQLLMAMKLGATLIVERSFAFPALIYKRMDEFKATVFPGVPTIFAMMLASHKKQALCFPAITRVTNTAAALPTEYIPYLQQIFPNALIYKMYGLTECKRVSYLEPELLEAKPASVGKAIPGTEIYLLTPDGRPVAPGEPGILYVRGPHIMAGYWKQPELTAKMLKPGQLPGERVLCTHDWFRMDAEGFFYFVGRSDDIIKTRGEKVSPLEVENVLYQIPGVVEAAVIGVSDELLGQSIKAFVVLEPDRVGDAHHIRKYCMAHLENFMVPKDVVFMPALPKTANGKIDKLLLAQPENTG